MLNRDTHEFIVNVIVSCLTREHAEVFCDWIKDLTNRGILTKLQAFEYIENINYSLYR